MQAVLSNHDEMAANICSINSAIGKRSVEITFLPS